MRLLTNTSTTECFKKINNWKNIEFCNLLGGLIKMKAITRIQIGFCVVFMTLILMCVQIGMAQDHLLLTGVVRSVDSNSGIIRINVTSEGCKGIRDFKVQVDAAKDIEASLLGKRMQFYIDSATCVSGRTYNILAGGQP